MTTENIIKQELWKNSLVNHKDGYLSDFKDNLVPTVSPPDFENDLRKGSGKELENKFLALHSSSALCVNFFGFFKNHLDKFPFFGETNFVKAEFEKQLRTGLGGTPPNLDFYLENDNYVIGIESKFLEPLTPKQPEFSASYSESYLNKLDNGLSKIVNYYLKNNSKAHLDTAQLIKHSIGLLNNRGDKKAKLIYVYWQPENFAQIKEYSSHQADLAVFSNLMKGISNIEFHHTTYGELCKNYIAHNYCQQHILLFKQKYLLT
jgi:hypothetical protein